MERIVGSERIALIIAMLLIWVLVFWAAFKANPEYENRVCTITTTDNCGRK